MTVDYNEYDKKLLAVSLGTMRFGNKVGRGLGTIILVIFLVLGSYDAILIVVAAFLKYAIYGFCNIYANGS